MWPRRAATDGDRSRIVHKEPLGVNSNTLAKRQLNLRVQCLRLHGGGDQLSPYMVLPATGTLAIKISPDNDSVIYMVLRSGPPKAILAKW